MQILQTEIDKYAIKAYAQTDDRHNVLYPSLE